MRKEYADGGVAAVAGVTFGIRRGEYVALCGPSGCGKSSLLHILSGMDAPTSGDVFFEDISLQDRRLAQRLRVEKIGMVFQSFHLLPTLTASENVQVPMLETTRSVRDRKARAAELLESVGLGARLHHKPTQLSGGERQRVAVARALANDPPLIFADEPTGNLDSVSGAGVLELFDRLHAEQGRTLVVVTHSTDVASRAKRHIHMADGRIVSDDFPTL